MRLRKTSRLIVLDQNDKVLLLHFVHKNRSYWATPGGEVEAYETIEQAAKRELYEETGLTLEIASLGKPVWHNQFEFKTDADEKVLADECFFVVHVTNPQICCTNWTKEESELIAECRWWSIDELKTTNERIFPENLAELLENFTQIRIIDLQKTNESNFTFRGVECVILTFDNKILLQQRGDNWQRFPKYLANFGGQIEANETPIQALIRELHEELGAKVNEKEVISLGVITEAATNHSDLIYVYFWHDKNNTITGCYEGAARNYNNVQEALMQPKIMDSVRFTLTECQKRNFL